MQPIYSKNLNCFYAKYPTNNMTAQHSVTKLLTHYNITSAELIDYQ